MNARTVKKFVLRRRCHSLFGRRAFVEAKVPMSIYPEPCPAFVPPGKPWLDGVWTQRQGDKIALTAIEHVSSGSDPSINADHTPHFVEHDRFGWSWWECSVKYFQTSPGVEDDLLPDPDTCIGEEEGPVELIAVYRAREKWLSKYVHGEVDRRSFPELVRRLIDVGSWARATYGNVSKDSVIVQWSVKWFYPDTLRGFSNSLSRTMRAFKRAGVPILVS